MKKTIFLLIISLCCNGFAQQYRFILNKALPQTANSAFTGTSETGRVNYGFHAINLASTHSFTSNYLSYDQYINKLHGGLGIQFGADNFARKGLLTRTIRVNYAFQQAITEKLSLSVGVGTEFRREKANKHILCPTCPVSQFGYFDNQNYIEINTGALLYNDDFFIHFNYAPFRQKTLFVNSGTKRIEYFSAGAGYRFTPFGSEELSINTGIEYSNKQNFHAVNFQAIFNAPIFSAGGIFSPNEYVAFVAGINLWQFQLKSMYYHQFSPLSNLNYSPIEIILQYNLGKELDRKSNAFSMNLF